MVPFDASDLMYKLKSCFVTIDTSVNVQVQLCFTSGGFVKLCKGAFFSTGLGVAVSQCQATVLFLFMIQSFQRILNAFKLISNQISMSSKVDIPETAKMINAVRNEGKKYTQICKVEASNDLFGN